MAKRETRKSDGQPRLGHDPATVARWCGDLDEPGGAATDPPGDMERKALERLDSIAEFLSDDAPSMADLAIRFAIADDVEDKPRRLRAIVARTYARAHALAWCRDQTEVDAATLRRQAKAIERALRTIDPEYEPGVDDNDTTADALVGWWMQEGAPFAVADRAMRAIRFDVDDVHSARSAAAADACVTLSGYAAMLRRTAEQVLPKGRPRETPRHWFVLRLAEVYALTTGVVPVFDGGTIGGRNDLGSVRKRGNSWHDLVNTALDLTGFRGTGGTTNAVLRAVADLGRFNPSLPPNFFVLRLQSLTDWSSADGRISIKSMPYSQLPSVGLEIDLGIDVDVKNLPTSRERAYAPASLVYRGRTHRL